MTSKARHDETGMFRLGRREATVDSPGGRKTRQDAREAVITIRTRSAAFFAPSFFMMLAR